MRIGYQCVQVPKHWGDLEAHEHDEQTQADEVGFGLNRLAG